MSLSFDTSDRKTFCIKGQAGLFTGGTGKLAGHILFKSNTPGTGKYYFYRLNAASTAIEEVALMEAADVAAAVAAIARQERLRFQFYPVASKTNWFWSGAIAGALPIGYQCKIVSWKVWVMPTRAIASGTESVVDYMGEDTPAVVVDSGANTSVVAKEVNFVNPANGSIGIKFRGTGNPKKIELYVNGSLKDGIDMEAEGGVPDSGGGTPLNKLYVAEVLIQVDNSNTNNQQEQ